MGVGIREVVGGWVSPCAVSPLWCGVSPLVVFPPAVCGGCAPLRSSDPARSFLLTWDHLLRVNPLVCMSLYYRNFYLYDNPCLKANIAG